MLSALGDSLSALVDSLLALGDALFALVEVLLAPVDALLAAVEVLLAPIDSLLVLLDKRKIAVEYPRPPAPTLSLRPDRAPRLRTLIADRSRPDRDHLPHLEGHRISRISWRIARARRLL